MPTISTTFFIFLFFIISMVGWRHLCTINSILLKIYNIKSVLCVFPLSNEWFIFIVLPIFAMEFHKKVQSVRQRIVTYTNQKVQWFHPFHQLIPYLFNHIVPVMQYCLSKNKYSLYIYGCKLIHFYESSKKRQLKMLSKNQD